MKINTRYLIFQDAVIVVASILVAIFLVRTDALINLLTSTQELKFLGSFVAGIFFTSVFTTAPAIVTLGEIARVNTLFGTAFLGALGAVVGDLIIFRFVRDRFAEHFLELMKHNGSWKRARVLLKLKFFRWLTFFVAGLIIASPLPDELGIGLLGFSKIRPSRFVLLSFTFNFIGILLVGFIARMI
ncbi:MAG: hypothetical protein A2754_02540 [Candidatus Magasanikbacteria bacterium RIFCSPHIGHO2_01_FULL_47_8]|uniref:Uncharacterized protein n=1 Tax=Candidatus Magasanikbacteria bacterium RIFCSPHIGHO2_01_FULL_47_8 TaxID=1798673 RepID=A0A1F6MBY1_9BACT|nr:MAG: hypothetical protein A2754_02540 [Candidatus Magasanikbacteria bacterium RIFCSPHIGHO2_01_FULL_47_8]